MTAAGRAATFMLLLVLNLATLAPFYSPAALYEPQLVIEGRFVGATYVLLVATAGTFVMWGALRMIRCLSAHGWVRSVVAGLVILTALTLTSAAAFYAKLGAYPGTVVLSYVVTDPVDCIDYVRNTIKGPDAIILAALVFAIVGVGVASTYRVWHEAAAIHLVAWNILVGGALFWAFRDAPMQTGSLRFLITQHSTPLAKYVYDLVSIMDSNRVELMRPYVPRRNNMSAGSPVPAARHVLLVIAECLRADRLPAYGYRRNTLPFITSESAAWIAFARAYAHGPSTADNFPVLFNSQYFAAVTRENHGASAAWDFLRKRGARSAFLSAGAMEWAGIRHSLDLQKTDYEVIASSSEAAGRLKNSEAQFDYGLDDSIPLKRYLELLETELTGRASFAVLHFVGSHYPFQYPTGPDVFVPSLRQPAPVSTEPNLPNHELQHGNVREQLTDSTVTRISNSFDNSLVRIDLLVKEAVQSLERAHLLDDSVIIVTSDHGESFGEHRTLFHGTTLYDEQVRVPLLVRVGAHLTEIRGRLQARRLEMIGQVDLMPTILHILFGSEPSIAAFEGGSFLSDGQKPYELLMYRGIGEKVAVATNDRKYVFDIQGRRGEEYFLTDDPAERHNLWQTNERSLSQFIAALVRRGVLVSEPPQ